MKRIAWLAVIAVALSLVGRVTAQQARPDFSGKWQSEGASLVIKQDLATLTVADGSETTTYNLNGTETQRQQTGAKGTSTLTSRVQWVGSAMVVSTTTASPIGTWQDLDVYSMDYGPKLNVVHVGTQTTMPMMSTKTRTYTRN